MEIKIEIFTGVSSGIEHINLTTGDIFPEKNCMWHRKSTIWIIAGNLSVYRKKGILQKGKEMFRIM